MPVALIAAVAYGAWFGWQRLGLVDANPDFVVSAVRARRVTDNFGMQESTFEPKDPGQDVVLVLEMEDPADGPLFAEHEGMFHAYVMAGPRRCGFSSFILSQKTGASGRDARTRYWLVGIVPRDSRTVTLHLPGREPVAIRTSGVVRSTVSLGRD